MSEPVCHPEFIEGPRARRGARLQGAPDEGSGYTVTVPALPEIVTEGDTIEQALFMAKDAIELSLAARKDEGLDIPASDADGARLEIVSVTLPAA